MKKAISFVLALVLVALFCAGVLLLTGRCTIGGALGPIAFAWFEKLLRKKY